ncbi:hypothetical protein CC80DRAFT_493422 [Byssothecium circinans]|uniref:P-loop containing nucleoside triphosphate hydrolase protein n=1 Tax=Byssothecium circinans TaxID=147558 RepID=A0A6A5TWL0_9PLEO|nr:hypothetical protein CC80DRAFT_493422 [Byssothecium circinans]
MSRPDFSRGSSSTSPGNFTQTSSTFSFGTMSHSDFTFARRTPSPSARSAAASRNSHFTPSPDDSSSTAAPAAASPSTNSPGSTGIEDDPDRPLPSIERGHSTISSRQSTPNTTLCTPSASIDTGSGRASSERDELHKHLGHLTLSTPEDISTPVSRSHTPTPLINVTPVPAQRSPQAQREDSLVHGFTALQVGSSPNIGPNTSYMRDSRSPTPSNRRRSGSQINEEIHRVEDEEPPQALFHTKEVQDGLKSAKSMMERMLNVLSSSSLHQVTGSGIENLQQQATKLSAFELQSTRTVGLVGDSGAGKSSLINSLLDRDGFARTSDSGAACTCVVTEYHYHDRDDFTIHVDYFNVNELKSLYENLLRAYRDNQIIEKEQSPDPNDKPTKAEKERLQATADIATSTFQASFPDLLESRPTILNSLPFDYAIKLMLDCADRLLRAYSKTNDGAVQESFDSATACSTRLTQLTSQIAGSDMNDRAQASTWPFIKKLRVYLKSCILSHGLVIADLPGLRDSNAARQSITERYLRDCNQIFVVVKIGRAVTDMSVKEIFELARRANLANVGVVCTKSDVINVKEAKNDWPRERETIDSWNKCIEKDTKTLSKLKEAIGTYTGHNVVLDEEETSAYVKLLLERPVIENSKKSHEFELNRHLITVRNEHVSRRIQDEYRDHPASANIRVFCVSNNMYGDNRNSPISQARPHLDLSGIIDLRRYCVGLVAESHLRTTKAYIVDEIPAFLSSVELWLQAGSGSATAERKQQILEVVAAVHNDLDELTSPVSQLEKLSCTLQKYFNEQIRRHMESTRRISKWTGSAREASMIWNGWRPETYKAFCRNYGNHGTKAVNYHCWNQEAMEAMFEDMKPIWDKFDAKVCKRLEEMENSIERSFEKAMKTATVASREFVESESERTLPLLAGMLLRRQLQTIHAIHVIVEDLLNKDLLSLRNDAFLSPRTSFIGMLMEEKYEAANKESGPGSDGRRKHHITSRFGSRSLLDDHRRLLTVTFISWADRLEDEVKKAAVQQVELIEADLRMIRSENAVLESEKNPQFRNRLSAELGRMKRELESVNLVLENMSV